MPRSFNDRTSQNKTTVERKINVSDNTSGANFPNPLMSVNNLHNFDAHPWPKNTILIAGDSIINGINEKLSLQRLNQLKLDVLVEPRQMTCTLTHFSPVSHFYTP